MPSPYELPFWIVQVWDIEVAPIVEEQRRRTAIEKAKSSFIRDT
jgi:hypothetical protein